MHLLVALEHDSLAIGTARGAQVSRLGGRTRGAVGAGDNSHEAPAQQHEGGVERPWAYEGKLWRAAFGPRVRGAACEASSTRRWRGVTEGTAGPRCVTAPVDEANSGVLGTLVTGRVKVC